MRPADGIEGSRLPDPRVLGWLLATHIVLQALPGGRKLGEFLAGALRDVPGVSRGGLCLPDPELEQCGQPCPALERGHAGEPIAGCPGGEMIRLPLKTARGSYGGIVLEIADRVIFEPYEPFIANFAGSLALLLENRQQAMQLEQAFQEQGESEKRYRQLFTEMAAGHAVHEIILDQAGVPCDYRFLEVNPAFEKLTGLRAEDVVGRGARDTLPGLESSWVERYGQVALSGEPLRFDDYNQDLDRHYDVVAYRPQPGQFAVIFTDVTDRKRIEEQLREASEELAALNEELQAQNEALQVAQHEAARLMEDQRTLFQRLQEALLDVPQSLPGVELGHLYRSATKEARIGGDFYDVFQARGGRVAVLIGDVSGHGLEAARIAALVKDVVHAFSHQFRRPRLVLRETNRLLVERNLPGFVTAFLGFLDPGSGTLVYSSAGHPPPLLLREGRAEPLESASSPLGVFADARYRDTATELQEGSLLLLYTDGITEVRGDREVYGEARLVEALVRRPEGSVHELPSKLLDEALAFSGGVLRDDVALLAIRYLGVTSGQGS